MTIHKLEKPQWRPFFDAFSTLLEANDAEIEVGALNLGHQVEAEWAPLLGITYDPKDDVVDVALDGVDHLIYKPRDIYLDNGASELAKLEIVDADGIIHVVQFKDRLALPPPGR